MAGAGYLPDGTDKAVQVGLFAVVEPLGIEAPSRISAMSIPITDSLGKTITDSASCVHRGIARASAGVQQRNDVAPSGRATSLFAASEAMPRDGHRAACAGPPRPEAVR